MTYPRIPWSINLHDCSHLYNGYKSKVNVFWTTHQSFQVPFQNDIYRVSHKKRNGGFSVACDLKVPYLSTSSNQATPAEENDTKIIKFDWVILILWPFVKTQSISKFARFLRPMSKGLCWEWPFIVVFWGSPLIHVSKRKAVQRDSPRHYNERLFPT